MQQQPPQATPPVGQPATPASRSGKASVMAILSLVLGILGFFTAGLAGLIGIILGSVAIVGITRSAGRLGGHGLAIAGIALSTVSLVVGLLLLGTILSGIGVVRQVAVNVISISSLRQVSVAARTYSTDYNDYLPRTAEWVGLLDAYLQETGALVSLPGESEQGRAYAMNRLLDGLRYADVSDPQRTVLFFEAQFGSPLAGGPELLPAQPRYEQGYVIVFVDGHIENVIPEAIDSLVWQP